jgi:hypothetical protein
MFRVAKFLLLNILFFIFFSFNSYAANHSIDEISAEFLNKPYQLDPIGEGGQKPLYRFDRFDCQTYVETVLALILSDNADNLEQFQRILLDLRYSNSIPDYFTRNHFPDADWIPNNIKKGYLKYSDLNQDKISLYIDKKTWFESKIKSDDKRIPPNVVVTLPYIPLSKVPDIINKIPDGAIIMIVKPSFLLITHMGFAIWKNDQLYLRAASSVHNKVIDILLLSYLQHEPNIKGIVVLEMQKKR